jgi:stage V sporulation protein G
MKITDVKVFPVDEDKLKAYATITFDNCFIVRDLKVISGNKGYFIAMPSKKRKDGTFRDVAHPLNSETRKMIEDAVLEVYEKENVTGAAPATFHDDDIPDVEGDVSEPEETGAHGRSEATDPESGSLERGAAGTQIDEAAGTTAPGSVEEEAEDTGPVEPGQVEEPRKGAEENPVIEPSDDPEKAFGYEE